MRRLTEQRRDEPVSIEHYFRRHPDQPLEKLPRDKVVGEAALYAMQVVERTDEKPEFVLLVRGEHVGELKQIVVRAVDHCGVGPRIVRVQSENGEGLEIRFVAAA
jgi:hypothetical protein